MSSFVDSPQCSLNKTSCPVSKRQKMNVSGHAQKMNQCEALDHARTRYLQTASMLRTASAIGSHSTSN
jgi:hypothetical protein